MNSTEASGCRRPVNAPARSKRLQRILLAVGMVLSIAHAGCEQSPYELAPVRGTVRIDGRPLAGGRVMFAPIAQGDSREAGKPAFGTIQSDGNYILTTYRDNDGAVVGEHWITIFGPQAGAKAIQHTRSTTPKFRRFVVRQKQPVVAGQNNQIDIQVTTQEIARFAAQ